MTQSLSYYGRYTKRRTRRLVLIGGSLRLRVDNDRFFGLTSANLRAEISSTDRTKRLESILTLRRQIDGAT